MWEKTVMSQERVNSIHCDEGVTCLGYMLVSRMIAHRQAELTGDIAFKAGIREVLEWIDHAYGQDMDEPYIYIIQHAYKMWTDKLKEWGIEA